MASQQPRWLIIDFFAAFVRRTGNRIAIAHLIQLMSLMGLDEQTVRSSISRLKRRGWLVPDRTDGQVGYRLSGTALDQLSEGDARVYHLEPADPDDGWCVIAFSIPESLRAKRHTLRSKLTWWGFGNVIPGVWIGPQRASSYAMRIVDQIGVREYASVFDARYLGMDDLHRFVQSCWDFNKISVKYDTFIEQHNPGARSRHPMSNEDAFVQYLSMLNSWRSIPFLDPGLPLDLLPKGWRGYEATRLFHELSDELLDRALNCVWSVTNGASPVTGSGVRATSC